jgi:hypothetical protein
MIPDLRRVQVVMAATHHSLEAAVKLLAAGASQVLKQAGVLRAEEKIAQMLYLVVVDVVKVVESSERAKAKDGDQGQEAGG